MSYSFKYKMYYTRTHRKEKPKTLHDDQYGALLEYWQTEGFEEISERASQKWASDCGGCGQIVHYGGVKPRLAYEKEMRDKLGREPKVDEVFLGMYTREDEEGNIEWASQATEDAYNRYLENIAPHTINEEGEESIIPPPDVQMQIVERVAQVKSQMATMREEMRAEMQTMCEEMRAEMRAEMQTMREEMSEKMHAEMQTMREEMQTMQSRHQAELEQYRMMLILALQNRTGQPSQPGQNFTVNEPFHHQAGLSQPAPYVNMSNLTHPGIYRHFPDIIQPNTFPMFYNPAALAHQPPPPRHSQMPNSDDVSET